MGKGAGRRGVWGYGKADQRCQRGYLSHIGSRRQFTLSGVEKIVSPGCRYRGSAGGPRDRDYVWDLCGGDLDWVLLNAKLHPNHSDRYSRVAVEK